MRDVGENGWSLAPWSSRGPTLDNRIKPDICAPGVRISAAMAGTQGRFVTYSGTSMASPFVAGVVALMLEANPYLTTEDIKDALFSTAQDWGEPGKDLDYGYGRIDAYEAIQKVVHLPGRGPANPTHGYVRWEIGEGEEQWFWINVRDTSRPLALTLLMTDYIDDYYDLDMYLYDSNGNLVDWSFGMDRQETINYRGLRPGIYYIQLQAYEGSGGYTLDVSWK